MALASYQGPPRKAYLSRFQTPVPFSDSVFRLPVFRLWRIAAGRHLVGVKAGAAEWLKYGGQIAMMTIVQKRERFRHPSCSTSERLLAFLELLDDPGANWMDVVAGLEFDEPVSGWAAAKLNRAFGSPCKPPDLNKVASFWMSKLKEHGIDPMSPISIRTQSGDQ